MVYPLLPDVLFRRRLGGGTYGQVYLVSTGQFGEAAFKILTNSTEPEAKQESDRRYGEEEYQILTALAGIPSVPRVYGLYAINDLDENPEGGVLFYGILMEYVQGPTLWDKMKQVHSQGLRPTGTMMLKLASNLAYVLDNLRSLGYAHRDIKPDNIILREPYYQPVLIDLGLSCHISTCAGFLATPRYSPEEIIFPQYVVERLGTRTAIEVDVTGEGFASQLDYFAVDSYALGKTLQEVWVGSAYDVYRNDYIPDSYSDQDVQDIIYGLTNPVPSERLTPGEVYSISEYVLEDRGVTEILHSEYPLYQPEDLEPLYSAPVVYEAMEYLPNNQGTLPMFTPDLEGNVDMFQE